MSYTLHSIVTKKFDATDLKGARVKAKHLNGTKTIAYNQAWSAEDNHETAAEVLAAELGIEYTKVLSSVVEPGHHIHILE